MFIEYEVVYPPLENASSNFFRSTFRIVYFRGNAVSYMVWDHFALGKEKLQVLSRMVHKSNSEKINKKKSRNCELIMVLHRN